MTHPFKEIEIGDFFTVPNFVDEEGVRPIYQKVDGTRANNNFNAVLLNTGVLVNVSDYSSYEKIRVEFSIHHE